VWRRAVWSRGDILGRETAVDANHADPETGGGVEMSVMQERAIRAARAHDQAHGAARDHALASARFQCAGKAARLRQWPSLKGGGLTLVLSIFRRQVMRSLMIKHAAKITAINPSAARFAHEEMLGFMLVRISVLGNIFSARDLHSSLFNLCFP
jgi:hypothetical protein